MILLSPKLYWIPVLSHHRPWTICSQNRLYPCSCLPEKFGMREEESMPEMYFQYEVLLLAKNLLSFSSCSIHPLMLPFWLDCSTLTRTLYFHWTTLVTILQLYHCPWWQSHWQSFGLTSVLNFHNVHAYLYVLHTYLYKYVCFLYRYYLYLWTALGKKDFWRSTEIIHKFPQPWDLTLKFFLGY